MNTPDLRARCAARLEAAAADVAARTAFLGFDGFVDEIIAVVDQRANAAEFTAVPTIQAFADRLAAAAGRSTNVELVTRRTKIGGNGPIMANALARAGVRVAYVGALGHPNPHPVFTELAANGAAVHSIADPGRTDALEFTDGKLLLGKMFPLAEVTWENLVERFGRQPFERLFATADLVAFVNWTMLPFMSEIWEAVQAEVLPRLKPGPRRKIFFDLADPEKRPPAEQWRALELIARFRPHFEVILGLNEKEAFEIAAVLGLPAAGREPAAVLELARAIRTRTGVDTLVVHPVRYALSVTEQAAELVEGPYVARPTITTGAGDHFNAGFCLGKLLGLDDAGCLLAGVTTSGAYVRSGLTPALADLVRMLRDWPAAA
jgi:sugar/nucleoside kinase (ribokinase family)